jgi:hypothetical protein
MSWSLWLLVTCITSSQCSASVRWGSRSSTACSSPSVVLRTSGRTSSMPLKTKRMWPVSALFPPRLARDAFSSMPTRALPSIAACAAQQAALPAPTISTS